MAFVVPQETIEEIKSRIDLADLISSYGIQVKRVGSSQKACCPFHHEKTPSFHINSDKGFFHCFGCGESGDAFKFVQKYEGLQFVDAAKKLAAMCGIEIQETKDTGEAQARKRLYALHAGLSAFFRKCLLQDEEAYKARSYLESRKLSGEVAEDFAIGYVPKSSAAILKWAREAKFSEAELETAGVLLPAKYAGEMPYNRFGGRLIFTIFDRVGRPIAFSARILDNDKTKAKYVNSPETPIFRKSSVLFALDRAAGAITKSPRREAIVCEGQIDVIRAHSCGFTTAVASQGTAFTEEHVQLLKRCADSVVLVFDSDKAGQKAAIKTGTLFLAAGVPVRVATLPAGEDPDSMLKNEGVAAFQARLDAAESIAAFLVRAMQSGEADPNSIDAISRISKAVLATASACSSAVMRAAVLEEAAKILRVPVQAFYDDYDKMKQAFSKPRKTTASKPKSGDLQDESKAREAEMAEILEGSEASSPNVAPPPTAEIELCKLLAANEKNNELFGLLEKHAPDELFSHPFTVRFVNMWKKDVAEEGDSMAGFSAGCSVCEGRWLDGILTSESMSFSELPPVRILQDLMRRLWMDALERFQKTMPGASTPENDERRLKVSMRIRRIQRGSWDSVTAFMTVGELRA
jgi:DNA primase